MKIINKTNFLIITVLALMLSIEICSATVFAWGDNGGMRQSYTLDEINAKASEFGNTPFFNTISDSVIGDEKNFVGAHEDTGVNAGADNLWYGNNIDVEDGKTYVVRLYVHNNNSNSVAKNTTVRFQDANKVASTLEMVDLKDKKGNATGEKKQMHQVQINGFISSSNANPSEYWDNINLNADVPFHLEYINDSAQIESNGKVNGSKLGNEIISTGVQIGYDKLDGQIPGGYEYACYITIQVKVVYDYDFTVEAKVRLAGDKEWQDSIDAKIGDKVEFQMQYRNTSDQQQDDAAAKDILPSNLRYVEGSTKLKNSHHPDGIDIQEDYLLTDALKIGSYGPGANAYLMFTAEVVDDNLAQGKNTLVNWSQAGVGDTTIQDNAQVVVYNNKRFYTIVTIYVVLIVICLITIVILIRRIIKRNKAKNKTK